MEKEPSYYEVALTNRQVVVGFVILLACLFAAFLSGVWIGRDAVPTAAAQIADSTARSAGADGQLEKLTFFGDRGGSADGAGARPASAAPSPAAQPVATPPASAPTAADRESEQMRETLEAEMQAHREDAAPAEPPASEGAAPAVQPPTPAPGTRVRRAPAPAAAQAGAAAAPAIAPATAPAATSEPATPGAAAAPFWIQVYSSTNGARANEIAARLKRSKFEVRVLETPVAGSTTFRVRVGPYPARSDADRVAQRLRRDFRLDTWVTDQP